MRLTVSTTLPDIEGDAKVAASAAEVKNLNTAAFAIQKGLRADLPRSFTLRSKWLVRGILVTKASAARPFATVYSNQPYMRLHEDGGTVRGGSKKIAVPAKIRKAKGDRITRANKPTNVLRGRNVFVNRKGTAIMRSMQRKLVPLYILTREATYEPSWGMVDKAREIAQTLGKNAND